MVEENKGAFDLSGLTIVAITGAWLAGILLASLVSLPSLALLIGAVAAFLLMLPLRHDSQGRLAMLLIGSLLLGALRYTFALPFDDPQAIYASIGNKAVQVRAYVADEPKVRGRERVLTAETQSISTDGGLSWQAVHGQLEVVTLGTALQSVYDANYGDNVELRGKIQPAPPHSSPGIFASMSFPRVSVKSNSGNPILVLLYQLRSKLARVISQALPQPEAALLIALLLSLRSPLLKTITPAFNETGTAHLIAPSGFKVTVLAGLVISSTRWLYKRKEQNTKNLLPAQKRGGWQQWLVTILVTLTIFAYTLLSGAGPAALRAGIMGILLIIAPRIGRTYNIYTALALLNLLFSLFDPFVLWDIGFLLSFLGTLGIVLLTPFFQHLLRPLERLPLGHIITEIMAVTLAAQVATFPIGAVTFNEISLIAPVTNVLTVPLLGLFILLGMAVCCSGLLFPFVAQLCGWVAWPLLWYLLTIVNWCANLPGAFITANMDSGIAWLYYACLTLVMSFTRGFMAQRQQSAEKQHSTSLFSQRTWRIAQLCAALLIILATGSVALAAQPDGHLTIDILDVGPAGQPAQGEAIFIRSPDGKTALIDGGIDGISLAQALDSRLPSWQRSLDIVLLTTAKTDHLNGLQNVVGRYQIGRIFDAGMLHPNVAYALWRRTITKRNIPYAQVSQGTSIALGTQVQFQVLWPLTQLHKGSNEEVDNGLIVRLVSPGLRILFLGVAAQSKYALSGLQTTIAPNYLPAEIVHTIGESGKTFPMGLASVLQEVHPAWLLISPAGLSTKQRKLAGVTTILPPTSLPSGNWQVLQTAQVGTIEITSGNGGWNVNTT